MHIEVLVEDSSGKRLLERLIPKIIGTEHTFRVISYKGVGRIPANMRDSHNAGRRILLDNLPKLLKGYGRTFARYPATSPAALVVVCDLDDKCLRTFRQDLLGVLAKCNPRPVTRFCVAIEEGEAWLLGDEAAVRAAYPAARDEILNTYVQDSICGTWEKLADAVHPGGAALLTAEGYHAVGAVKIEWAERISRHMDITRNASGSFVYFREKILSLVSSPATRPGRQS